MRRYPARCPTCKEYGEPCFNLNSHYGESGITWKSHANADAVEWFCTQCQTHFKENEDTKMNKPKTETKKPKKICKPKK